MDIPAGVTSIGERAFSNCRNLTTVDIPAGVTSIGTNPFSGCRSLGDITVDLSNLYYSASGGMFLNKNGDTLIAYPTAAGAVSLSASITNIGDSAFAGANLTSLSSPKAASIGNGAFNSCEAMTWVDLPEAINISEAAFIYCHGLTTVSLPAAETIGNSAFTYCRALETLELPAAPPNMGTAFTATNDGAGAGTTLTIMVPSSVVVSAYETAWNVEAVTAAGGNTTVYGNNHKQIVITTAP
jgi:hypothetical protein